MSPGTPRVALRKMTGVERKKALALAGSLLFGGEHKDSIVGTVRGYLTARGWGRAAADERAHEVYYTAVAGDVLGTPPGGTTP